MWETAEEITAGLRSGIADDVAGALEGLEFQRDIGEPVAIAMPTADELAPLGPELPDEVASRFVRLLDRYEDFSPPPARADVEREAALAAARYGPSSLALEASLILKKADAPGEAVRRGLAAVAERGVADDEIEHATAFVSYLLAGDDRVRSATLDVLAGWRDRPALARIIDGVVAELDDEEASKVSG